jgi:hypothetical protein
MATNTDPPDLSEVMDFALRKSSTLVGVCVPVELLSLCLGVIEEMHKTHQTSASFNDEVQLAIAQLREHLK